MKKDAEIFLKHIAQSIEKIEEFTQGLDNPEIEWSEMSKTRDKLIHGYFGVDIDLTWDIVISDN